MPNPIINRRNIFTGVNALPEPELGVIYFCNNFTSLADYGTAVGGSSYYSVSGGKLVIGTTGSGLNNYTKRIEQGSIGINCYSQWTNIKYFTITAIGGGTDFFAYGVNSENPNSSTWLEYKFYFTSAKVGKVEIISSSNGTGNTIRNISASAISINIGDRYRTTAVRDNFNATFTVDRLDSGGAVIESTTVSYLFNPLVGERVYGQGGFHLCALNGTSQIEIDEISISVQNTINPNIVYWGDSISQGFNQTDYSLNWPSQLQALSGSAKTFHNFAISGNRTQELVDSVQSIININPKYCVIMIGVNDRLTGVAQATWEANMLSFYNTLTAAGIEVVWSYLVACTAISVSVVNTSISANYPTSKIATNMYIDTKGAGFTMNPLYDGDPPNGTHLNDLGGSVAAASFFVSIPEIF